MRLKDVLNVAVEHHRAGRLQQAETLYRQILLVRPSDVNALHLLGLVAHQMGHNDSAVQLIQKAIALRGNSAELYRNLGTVHRAQNKLDEAVKCFRRASELKPGEPQVDFTLGCLLGALGQLPAAADCFRRVLHIRPDDPAAHQNLGEALRGLGKFKEAAASYRRAIALKPDYPEALANLVIACQYACDWQELEALNDRLMTLIRQRLGQGLPSPLEPFYALSLPMAPAQLLELAKGFAAQKAKAVASLRSKLAFSFGGRPKRRLRIGYLAAEFHDHATSHLMLSLFGLHDREDFEVFAYSFGRDDGSVYRRRIIQDCDQFVDIRQLSHESSARRIFSDGIDILVDLKGYTRFSRPEILALRPAPIQVSFLGYPGTMGAEFIDYLIADRVVVPSDQESFFSEKIVELPHSYQVNDYQQPIAEMTPTRSECRLPENAFVFCCFSANYKIEPQIFSVWMRILGRVPGSVLWLMRNSAEVEENLRREAEARGVAGQRLIFAEKRPKPEHLARHRLADLFLDTYLYNAHTTGSDALWAGLPLVTCSGETFASRVCASLLRSVDLPELIVKDLSDYENLAVHLAHHPHELSGLRDRLMANRHTCPLFDTPRYAKHLEEAYRMMWRFYQAGEGPRRLTVPELSG